MAITDLTNTKWKFNDSITATSGYGKFNISTTEIGQQTYVVIGYKYKSSQDTFTASINNVVFGRGYNGIDSFIFNQNTTDGINFTSTMEGQTLEITGGTDATNTNLISWLEQNATQIVEPTGYTLRVNSKTLNLVNGKKIRNLIYKGTIYEIVSDSSGDMIPDDTTLVFTANTTDTYSVSWYNEDTTQEIKVYLNDELIGASSGGIPTIDFPYSLVSGESYRLTFKGGKLNIGNVEWFVSTSGGVKTQKQSTITEIIFGKNYGKYIYQAAFANSKITKLKLPSSIVEVADASNSSNGVFSGCTSLVKAVLNEGLNNIGSWMFYGCSALANITISNTVVVLGEQCFQNTVLTNLTIPSSVKNVGTQALYAAANNEITFKHTENDELTFATQIFNKPKNAVAMTIKHYGNPTVLNYDYATYNITPTFVDLREQQ